MCLSRSQEGWRFIDRLGQGGARGIIAAMSFVIGLIFLPETKDRDITTM